MSTEPAATQRKTIYEGEFTNLYLEDVADGCLTVSELEEKVRQHDRLVAGDGITPTDTYGVSIREALGILSQSQL